jgi:hypothetical protein
MFKPETRTARHDPSLSAKIVRRLPLVYADGESREDDRPSFVLAASGMVTLGEHLFVVQDNANWIAVVNPDDSVTAVPLPRGPAGARVFSKSRDNADDKVDLEACVIMQGDEGPELVAFGSGTAENRCWILRMTGPDRATKGEGPSSRRYDAKFLDASVFYKSLVRERAFSGGSLNIEGAIALDETRVLILQRGNAPPSEGERVDATGEVCWPLLSRHLDDPANVPPPPVENVIRYELGDLNGVRLTFSDAEYLGGGRILFSASAEDPQDGDGKVEGSVLGIIEPSGETRWTQVTCEDGSAFTGKIEGLSRSVHDASTIRFVIDDDDETAPSEIFEAKLSAGFGLTPA